MLFPSEADSEDWTREADEEPGRCRLERLGAVSLTQRAGLLALALLVLSRPRP